MHTSLTIQGFANDDLAWLRGWGGYNYGDPNCQIVFWSYNDLSAWAADTDDFPWWSQPVEAVDFTVSSWSPQTDIPVAFQFNGRFLTTQCPPPTSIPMAFDVYTVIQAEGDGDARAIWQVNGNCLGLKYPSASKKNTSSGSHYGGRSTSNSGYFVCIANPKYGETAGARCDAKG